MRSVPSVAACTSSFDRTFRVHRLIGYLSRDACCVRAVLMGGRRCREVVHGGAPHSRFVRLNVGTTRIAKKRARIQRALTQYVRPSSISLLASPAPFFRFFVLSFFRSFVLPFFRSRQTRRATAKNHRLPTIFSRIYFALAGNCYEATNQKKRERERNNRDVAITATIVVLALGTRTEPAIRRFYPRSLSACKNHAKRIKRQSVGR